MSLFKLISTFKHAGRKCAIVEVDIRGKSHNGYVELIHESERTPHYADMAIETEELTFKETLEAYNLPEVYVGFDTNHLHNFEHSHTRTFNWVMARTILLAEELNTLAEQENG